MRSRMRSRMITVDSATMMNKGLEVTFMYTAHTTYIRRQARLSKGSTRPSDAGAARTCLVLQFRPVTPVICR